MTKRTGSNLMLAAALLYSASAFSPATIPAQGTLDPLLQYQGVLRDAEGTPISGEVTVSFQFFDTDDPDGASPVWEESHEFTLTDGLVSAVLGQSSTLDPELFHGENLWLGIEVDDEGILLPMQQMLPSAQALYADFAGDAARLEGHTAADFLPSEGPTLLSADSRFATLVLQQESPSGLALLVDGHIESEGQIEAESYHRAEPRTYHKMISPADFRPYSSSVEYTADPAMNRGVYVTDFETNLVVQALYAPVELPAGAVIEEFRAYVEDNTDEEYLRVTLTVSEPRDVFPEILASVDSEELDGHEWLVDDQIAQGGTIDNSSDFLHVLVVPAEWNWAEHGNDLRLHGARITYTLDEVP